MPPDSLSRGRAAMMSLATLLLVAACGDHDTTPLEAAAPSTSTAEPAASGTVPAVQARNTWTVRPMSGCRLAANPGWPSSGIRTPLAVRAVRQW